MDKIKPLVSIVMLTYNHRDYIYEAVMGCIKQETDFPYELIICDDCSEDGTVGIIMSLRDTYPDKITLSLHEKNTGIAQNVKDGLMMVRGEYIAFCEGDDFWCDKDKLRLQVGFLEEHKEYNFCFHTTRVIYEGDQGTSTFIPNIYTTRVHIKGKEEKLTAKDLLARYMAHTSSYVGRWPYKGTLLAHWNDSMVFDVFMLMVLAKGEKIKYFDRVMSVYRRHATGYASGPQETSFRYFASIRGKEFIKHYSEIIRYSDGEYKGEMLSIINVFLEAWALYLITGRSFKELKEFFREYYDLIFRTDNIVAVFGLKSSLTAILLRACRVGRHKNEIVDAAVRRIKLRYYMGLLFDL